MEATHWAASPEGCAEAVQQIAQQLGLNPTIAFVRGDDLMPNIEELISRDQLVLGHEITVTLCKRQQHVEDHGFRTFDLLATPQDSLGWQDIPVSEAETSVQLLQCQHSCAPDRTGRAYTSCKTLERLAGFHNSVILLPW